MKAIVVYSGGMDSTVALYESIRAFEEIKCITFNYGSKHNHMEYECALNLCNELEINLKRVDLPLDDLLKSDLLKSGGEIPEGHYEDESMKKTVVPFRNGIMLSLAIAYAESLEFDRVILGNHAGDHAIYPDCRATFISAMNEAAAYGTYNNIRINSPFCGMTKRQIAILGQEFGIDWNKTWSCYKGGNIHCGVCGTCVERIEALQGFDKTDYEVKGER